MLFRSDLTSIDSKTGLPVQPGSVSFLLTNGTVVTAVPRADSSQDLATVQQVYSTSINTGNNLYSLPVGTVSITARYNSDGGLYPTVSTTSSAPLTVLRQATSITLTAPPQSSVVYGAAVSFSAKVAPTIPASGDNAIPFGGEIGRAHV